MDVGTRHGCVALMFFLTVGLSACMRHLPPPRDVLETTGEPSENVALAPRPSEVATPPRRETPAQNPVVGSYAGREIRASELCRQFFRDYREQAFAALSKMIGVEILEKEVARAGLTLPPEWRSEQEGLLRQQIAKEAVVNFGVGTSMEEYTRTRFREDVPAHLASRLQSERERWLFSRVIRLHALQSDRVELESIVTEQEPVIREVRQKLLEGAEFAALARRYSRHPSAEAGGRLPPLPREALNPMVAERAFNLPVGGVSGVLMLEAPGGQRQYQIVRVVARYDARQVTYADAREEIEAGLRRKPVDEAEWAAWYLKLERLYKVKLNGNL